MKKNGFLPHSAMVIIVATSMLAMSYGASVEANADTSNSPLHAAEGFLSAVKKRDIKALETALTKSTEPVVLFFWGEAVSGRETLTQWHREWFAEDNWKIPSSTLRYQRQSGDLAVVSFEILYEKGADRQFRIISSMLLTKEDSQWRIDAVQQTLLEGPDS